MTVLIRFALGRPITAAMIFLAVIIFGTISALVIPLDYLPHIPIPKLAVSASYPGLPPEEVSELLAVPLEESFSSLTGLTSVTTVCRKGTAVIELTFSWGTDMTIAAVETREKIDSGFHRLPSEAEKPVVLPVTPGEPPVLTLAALPEDGDLITARRLCEREITSRLQQIEGAGSVAVTGGRSEEIQVTVDEQKAARAGLSVGDIAAALNRANTAVPAGAIIEGDTEYTVITEGRFSHIDEIGRLRINPPAAGTGGITDTITGGIPLRDIADIRFAAGKQHSFFLSDSFDGTPSGPSAGLREAIVLQVRRRGDASPVTLARNIERELARISRSYGDSLSFTVIENSAELISSSVTSLLLQTVLGIAASFGVLFFFLGKVRYAVILLVMVPTSILFSVLLLTIAGKSLNIMSLGGIALSTGMIIDNGIVVLENMVRRDSALEGAAEVAPSIFGSTLTTLIVFVPVVFIPGLMGSLYTDLALAVVFALTGSYLCSVMFLPVLFSSIRGDSRRSRRSVTRIYAAVLGRFLRRPVLLFLTAGVVVALGMFFLSRTEFELFQEVNSNKLDITVRLPAGTPMAGMKRTGREILTILRDRGLMTNGWCIAGGEPNDPYFTSDPDSRRENLRLRVHLADPIAKRTSGYIPRISSLIQVEGGDVSVTKNNDLLSSLFENDTVRVGPLGGRVLQEEKIQEYTVVPREEFLIRSGTSREDLANTVRSALEGITATTFEREGEEIPVRILFGEERSKNLSAIRSLPVPASGGTPVTVGAAAKITEESNPSRIYRVDRKEAAAAEAQADPPPAALPALELVPVSAFLLALLLMYLALGAQFESFTIPLILFMSIPLSFTGVFTGLAVSGNSFDLSSSLGVLVLMGISINNAIILFETYRRVRDEGRHPLQAVFRGSLARVRPILMTALTTAAALLPVAIDPYNRSAQSGMAASVIGGLIFSTILTLIFLPPCYVALTGGKREPTEGDRG